MIFRILQIAIPFVWFGLVGGISFMETPLKFKAPDITLPLGLGIGRMVFFALNKIEIFLAVSLLITFLFYRPLKKLLLVVFAVIALILFLQTIWLLPVLDARTVAIIRGASVPPSNTHLYLYRIRDH